MDMISVLCEQRWYLPRHNDVQNLAFAKNSSIKLRSGSSVDLSDACAKLSLLPLVKLCKLFTKLGAPDMEALIVVRSDLVMFLSMCIGCINGKEPWAIIPSLESACQWLLAVCTYTMIFVKTCLQKNPLVLHNLIQICEHF